MAHCEAGTFHKKPCKSVLRSSIFYCSHAKLWHPRSLATIAEIVEGSGEPTWLLDGFGVPINNSVPAGYFDGEFLAGWMFDLKIPPVALCGERPPGIVEREIRNADTVERVHQIRNEWDSEPINEPNNAQINGGF